MNTDKLQIAIKNSGLKHKYIAEKLNMSENLFTQKILGNCKWKLDEVNQMRQILGLTRKDVYDIFFA